MDFWGLLDLSRFAALVVHAFDAVWAASLWDDGIRRRFNQALIVNVGIAHISTERLRRLRQILAESIEQVRVSGSSTTWPDAFPILDQHYISNFERYGLISILSSPMRANNCLDLALELEEFELPLLLTSSSMLFNYCFERIILFIIRIYFTFTISIAYFRLIFITVDII